MYIAVRELNSQSISYRSTILSSVVLHAEGMVAIEAVTSMVICEEYPIQSELFGMSTGRTEIYTIKN